MALDTLKKSSSYILSELGHQTSNDDLLNRQVSIDSASSKKPASLTEITDLYCALQDLVKTNVAVTPVNVRCDPKQKIQETSSVSNKDGEILEREESDNSSESDMVLPDSGSERRQSASRGNLTSSGLGNVRPNKLDETKSHRRGLSADSIDMSFIAAVENKASFLAIGRKFTLSPSISDSGSMHEQTGERFTEASSKQSARKVSRQRSNQPVGAGKKGVFSRLRSRSSPWLDEAKYRISIPAAAEQKWPRDNNLDSSQTVSQDLRRNASADSARSSSVQDIDQLCAALNLEYGTAFQLGEGLPIQSPEKVVNRIDHWYQQATAQATGLAPVQRLSSTSVLCRPTTPDVDTRRRRQSAPNSKGHRRESTSNQRKQDRRTGLPRHGSLDLLESANEVGTSNCPRENKANCVLNDVTLGKYEENCCETNLLNRTESSEGLKKAFRIRRKPSDEDTPDRFPRKPLFYVPNGEPGNAHNVSMLPQCKYGINLRASAPGECAERTLPLDQGLFYTDPEVRGLGVGAITPRLRLKENFAPETTVKSNMDSEESNRLRPKSMCAEEYYQRQLVFDEKNARTVEGDGEPSIARNSHVLENGVPTDGNGNLCAVKSKSMYAMDSARDKVTTDDGIEKSLWSKLKTKQNGVSKIKTILAGRR